MTDYSSKTRIRSFPESAPKSETREVRWRASHARALLVGAAVCLVLTLTVGLFALFKGKQKIQLQHQTQRTRAAITRRWSSAQGGATQYWVSYRYPQLPADHPDETMQITDTLVWASMSPGAQIAIHYTPADPEVNGMMGNKSHLFQRWLWTGGLLSALLILGPLAFYLAGWKRKQSDLWLVKYGKTAVGEITDVIETMIPRSGGEHWMYDVEYQFPLPDGEILTGARNEGGRQRRTWQTGTVVTIFFDPQNPTRHALYGDLPGEVVSSIGR